MSAWTPGSPGEWLAGLPPSFAKALGAWIEGAREQLAARGVDPQALVPDVLKALRTGDPAATRLFREAAGRDQIGEVARWLQGAGGPSPGLSVPLPPEGDASGPEAQIGRLEAEEKAARQGLLRDLDALPGAENLKGDLREELLAPGTQPQEPAARAGGEAPGATASPLDWKAEETRLETLTARIEGELGGQLARLGAAGGIAAAEILAEILGPHEGSPAAGATDAAEDAGAAARSPASVPPAPPAHGSLGQALAQMEALARERLEGLEGRIRELGGDPDDLRDELPAASSISGAEAPAERAADLRELGEAVAEGAAREAKPPEARLPAEGGRGETAAAGAATAKEAGAASMASEKGPDLGTPAPPAAPSPPAAPRQRTRSTTKNGSKRSTAAGKRPSSRRTKK